MTVNPNDPIEGQSPSQPNSEPDGGLFHQGGQDKFPDITLSRRVIKPYKLLQRIGAGGMGEVSVAERSVPVKRRVALKLIKTGMGSRKILASFDAERPALALINHLNIARMNNLAMGYWSLQQFDKSVPLFEELLPLMEKKLGRAHANMQRRMASLGVNLKDAGRVAEAIPLLEEAYQASRRIPTLRWVGSELLDAYARAGKLADAQKLIEELLSDARRDLPMDSPQLAGQLAKFGLILMEMKGYAEAEPLLRECQAIREKAEPDDWRTFNTQSMLGGALLGQAKHAAAEPLLLQGYEGMKAREASIPPQAKTRIPEALDRLIDLYEVPEESNKAEKYRELRAMYQLNPGEK
ncbi:MAG TPA: tetratricopeptide repeat protein [Pirellulaceae bacterium]|nr:tetratricopeptide repeat protein [Pirellulaceae bacterium]HMO91490.1 tetratricopeptide repeat protein [Pirellulaceae bacterium]HMP70955.1 tetratricopeptide repeat protein [Pirellulaceae bacterium]